MKARMIFGRTTSKTNQAHRSRVSAALTQLLIPNDFKYVIAVGACTGLLNIYQSILVSKARKRAGIKYPALYASNQEAERNAAAKAFSKSARLSSAPFALPRGVIPLMRSSFFAGRRLALTTHADCTQRAHGNTLEAIPFFLFSLIQVGLSHPRAAAVLGSIWLAGRVAFTIGYSSGDPSKRYYGVFHNIGFLGLLGTSVYLAFKAILA
ncbi:BQ2448_2547 [Microbotryum intermedium]|uniref:BQ2448_2547 protein n=1 Tax=Microbotryum intermedium TaxID=269621 RepID=A0A238F8S0_9BASI|nr:BQ2448_2547 [Microbotryum intermedium]